MIRRFVCIAMILILNVAPNFAQTKGNKNIQKKPRMNPPGSSCFEDREKYCKHIEKGQGRIKDCLKENEEKLTPACKEHLNRILPKES